MDIKDQTRKESKYFPFFFFFRNKIKRICQMNSQNLKKNLDFKVSQNTTNNSAKMMILLVF